MNETPITSDAAKSWLKNSGNAPVNADCVLAVAAMALAAERHDLPPMTKHALFSWVARNNAALLGTSSLLHDDSDPEPMLFAMLAEWTHANTSGGLAPEQAFNPSLSIKAALARVQQFRSAAAGGVA